MSYYSDYPKSLFGQTVLYTFLLFISPILVYYTYTALRNWFKRRRLRKQLPILPLTQRDVTPANGDFTGANISVIHVEAHGCHNTKNISSAGYPSNLKAGMWSQDNDGLPSYSDVCGTQSRY